ncbi:NAD-dependent epimerase/dehydratase family protein [Lewinella sp. W8]|uniref:NAD-dependent epimerase/dehydratase family protein n=1 Tax=Lewinella sp. W8 TaxID=2528208 RepID=UPI00156346AD|nr:NAD-dependent epimerase/dehydratase family protein [Lewinella sp. W8]
MPPTVLVTGANGHLGQNTVRALLEKGYQVRAFVRKTSHLGGLADLPVDFHYGDVRDHTSLLTAAGGCDAIIHHAAVYKIWAKTVEEIMAPSIEGTKNVFRAAAESGVSRIVYTSSTYAIGTATDPTKILDENDWNQHEHLPYSAAKTRSERLAWELSDQYNIPMISLCPGAVYGRYDYRVTPSNRMILDMMKGLGLTVKGLLSLVDARDAGKVHALAVENGVVGNRYVLTGPTVKMKTIGEEVNRVTGKRVLHLPFGRSVSILTGQLMEVAAKFTGWDPAHTSGEAREFSHRYARYDNSRTVEDFSYTFRSLEDTIRDTVRWLAFARGVKLNKKVRSGLEPEAEWVRPPA